MRNHRKAFLSFALLVMVSAFVVPPAAGFVETLEIDDRTEALTITETLDGVPTTNTDLFCRVDAFIPEMCGGHVIFSKLTPSDVTTVISGDSLQVVVMDFAGVLSRVEFTFLSDQITLVGDRFPEAPAGPGGLVETGLFQKVFDVTSQAGDELVIRFASDAETSVPEPATLALLGLGFAGLAWSRRRSLERQHQ